MRCNPMTPDVFMPVQATPPVRLSRKIPLLFFCIFAADILFFGQTIGLSAALFLLLLIASYLLENRAKLDAASLRAALILPAITVPALLENTSWISLGFATLAVLTVVLAKQVVWFSDPRRWLHLAATFPLLGLVETVRDTLQLRRTARSGGTLLASQSLVSWMLPVGASLVFALLFAYANPVIASWLDWLISADPAALPDATRVLFWMVCIPILWPLLRGKLNGLAHAPEGRRASTQTDAPLTPAERCITLFQSIASPPAVLRSLVLFNILFAVQMLLDAVYLLGGATLPEGMSYAHYAHRGAYPLVAAALLAGAFVIAAVRPGTPMERDPLIRRLVFAWIGQTLVLQVSSLWRLDLYVSAYSLTYLRAAAAIWMILVGFGLGWILIRLFANKSNTWLVKANLLTLLAVLHACCFIDFGGHIARFNVESRLSDGTEYGRARHTIDLSYLSHIGPPAIPALDRFASAPEAPMRLRKDAARRSEVLRERFGRAFKGWRGFTFRRYRLASYIAGQKVPIPEGQSKLEGPAGGQVGGQAHEKATSHVSPRTGSPVYEPTSNGWTLE